MWEYYPYKKAGEKVMAVKVKYYNTKGEKQTDIKLSGPLFESEFDESSLYYAIRGYLAKARQNNAYVKDKSEVVGSGRKPWRQKGTGRARVGSRGSPLWVGGGITFGPKRKEFNFKVNKKVKRKALYTAISKRVKDDKLIIIDKDKYKHPSTKSFAIILKSIGIYNKDILLLYNGDDENFYKSCRNIPNLNILEVNKVNAYEVLKKNWLIVTKEAIPTLSEVFG